MKKLLFILITFILCNKIHSQVVFCPAGAEWHYSFRYMNLPGDAIENEKIKYVRDSILNGETVKVLWHERFYKENHHKTLQGYVLTLIKQKGDTVFMKNAGTRNVWQILYNFAALPGQSWQDSIGDVDPTGGWAPYNSCINYTVTVDSVRNVLVNNFLLKRLYVRYFASSDFWIYGYPIDTVQITERLGCSRFMFNYFPDPRDNYDLEEFVEIKDFLCYQDNTFGLKQFANFACDYSNPVWIQEGINESGNLKIYPNPVTDKFVLESPGNLNVEKITIYNYIGKVVHTTINVKTKQEIDISQLPTGIYFLKTENKCGSGVFKIVKE